MSSAILDNVIREEQAPGTFRGRREKSIFIPHSYKDRQLSLISSLLEAGGYIGKKETVCVPQWSGFDHSCMCRIWYRGATLQLL